VPGESSVVAGIAGRYATALFDLAREARNLDETAAEFDRLEAMIVESEDLSRLVRSPVISRDDQARAMAAILEATGFGDLVRRFVGVVAANRRLFALTEMIRRFRGLLAEHRGELVANVTSARPLAEAQKTALAAALAQGLGRDVRDVKVETRIDENLIGGLLVRVGSRMVDSSLRTKLQNLELAMKGTG